MTVKISGGEGGYATGGDSRKEECVLIFLKSLKLSLFSMERTDLI